jgi:hypothetical protein
VRVGQASSLARLLGRPNAQKTHRIWKPRQGDQERGPEWRDPRRLTGQSGFQDADALADRHIPVVFGDKAWDVVYRALKAAGEDSQPSTRSFSSSDR